MKAKRTSTAGPGGGQRLLKVRVKKARRRSASSQRWLERQLNDPYVAASKREGYRSRAAYKLLEIDAKYHLLKPGQRAVDLGAAPGGWSQIVASRVKAGEGTGQVIAVDVLPCEPLPGVTVLCLDFMEEGAAERIAAHLRGGQADLVLSDMAAPTTGHARTDHLRSMGLAEAAAAFATDILAPGGAFLCKVRRGGSERDLLSLVQRRFAFVRHVKPPASRAESAELYLLATGFRPEPA